MKRVQLALNVSDLVESIDFYTKYFDVEPAKVRPGYANFVIESPPLKLVLIEGAGEPGGINHLGVEVFSTQEVADANDYFIRTGLSARVEDQTTCCYAVQDKVWVDGPDKTSWEVYTVLSDATDSDGISGDGKCCATSQSDSDQLAVTSTSCC